MKTPVDVVVVVNEGMVQDIFSSQPGVRVIVKDYGVDHLDIDQIEALPKDVDGDPYQVNDDVTVNPEYVRASRKEVHPDED